MLPRLSEGDLLLLAARPGQGKTLMGLQLLLDALRDGRRAVFFTLEYTQEQTRERMRSLSGQGDALEIVTSDDICAAYVVDYLAGAARGTVAVIDYLQILDQRRSKPALSEQIETLQKFARTTGIILAFISQIDRAYDPDRKSLPDIEDLRLPNQLDTGLFAKACFLQAGKIRFQAIT